MAAPPAQVRRIAPADNHCTSLFNLHLSHCGLTQATLLLSTAVHNETPWLKIETAGCFHSRTHNRGQRIPGHPGTVET